MNCPQCPTLLQRLAIGPLELDECPRCLGMWFDPGELQILLGAAVSTHHLQQRYVPKTGTPEPLSPLAACPRCRTSLHASAEHGNDVFGCGQCQGMWFPAMILGRMLDAHDAVNQVLGEEEDPFALVSPKAAPPAPPPAPPRVERLELPKVDPPRRRASSVNVEGPCPACTGILTKTRHKGVTLHVCGHCSGVFFSKGGLHAFLSDGAESWVHPTRPGSEPKDGACCPGCRRVLHRIRWQDRPVRVWACTGCWSMFASSEGLRKLTGAAPLPAGDEPLQGPALMLWRMVDAITEWIINPPKSDKYSAHKPKYD